LWTIGDLTHHENNGRFLEGTGSVVFDHVNRRAYAAISPRTNPEVLKELCNLLGYEPVTVGRLQESGPAILHTDVILSIGDRFAVFCDECISDPGERRFMLDSLKGTGREIISISPEQVAHFAGNVLELQTQNGSSVLAISTAAWLVLRPDQRDALQQYARIVESPLPLFERIGGGSARCMMADVHLPRV